jgi:hypothetical protein
MLKSFFRSRSGERVSHRPQTLRKRKKARLRLYPLPQVDRSKMTVGVRLRRVTVEGAALRHILLALARHRRGIRFTRHWAGSKLPSRHLVLGQPLFIGERFTNPVGRSVWLRNSHKNLMGLDFSSSRVMARLPPRCRHRFAPFARNHQGNSINLCR